MSITNKKIMAFTMSLLLILGIVVGSVFINVKGGKQVYAADNTVGNGTTSGKFFYIDENGKKQEIANRNECAKDLFYWDAENRLYSSNQDSSNGYDGFWSKLYCENMQWLNNHKKNKHNFKFTLFRNDTTGIGGDAINIESYQCYPMLTISFTIEEAKFKGMVINHNKNSEFWVNINPIKIPGTMNTYFDGHGVLFGSSYGTITGSPVTILNFGNEGYDTSRFSFDVSHLFFTAADLFPYFEISFKSDSAYNSYFWNFDYSFKEYDGYYASGFFNKLFNDKSHHWKSAVKSSCISYYDTVYDLVKEGKENGDITYSGSVENDVPTTENGVTENQVENIINNKILKNVKFSYLQQIPDTPFAYKVTKILDITDLESSYAYLGAFADALGVQNFRIFNTWPLDVKVDKPSKTFEVVYPTSVVLNTKTISGRNKYLFLDCGRSFGEYYVDIFMNEEVPIIEGVDKTKISDFFFNEFITPYAEKLNEFARLNNNFELGMYSLYGFWGYMPIPVEKFSITAIWDKMFDKDIGSCGIGDFAYVEGYLSGDSYRKLKDDYGYNWLENAFDTIYSGVTGEKYSVNHYFFYGDTITSYAYIGENGADDFYDNDTNIEQDVEDVVEVVGKGLKNVNFLSGLKKALIVVLVVILVIVAIVVLSYIKPIFSALFKKKSE